MSSVLKIDLEFTTKPSNQHLSSLPQNYLLGGILSHHILLMELIIRGFQNCTAKFISQSER